MFLSDYGRLLLNFDNNDLTILDDKVFRPIMSYVRQISARGECPTILFVVIRVRIYDRYRNSIEALLIGRLIFLLFFGDDSQITSTFEEPKYILVAYE